MSKKQKKPHIMSLPEEKQQFRHTVMGRLWQVRRIGLWLVGLAAGVLAVQVVRLVMEVVK